MRVVDYLGDLHELDAGRDTVKTGHSVPQLLSKEGFRCFLRIPDVKVRCPLTLLIQGKDLEPEAWHALKHPAGACGHLDYALPVETTGVVESMSGRRLARVYLQGEWRILVVTNMADDETGAPGV